MSSSRSSDRGTRGVRALLPLALLVALCAPAVAGARAPASEADEAAARKAVDATVEDAITRARDQLPRGDSLTHCEECDSEIPAARREAVKGVRLCVRCQSQRDEEQKVFAGYNRRGSKDSQLR